TAKSEWQDYSWKANPDYGTEQIDMCDSKYIDRNEGDWEAAGSSSATHNISVTVEAAYKALRGKLSSNDEDSPIAARLVEPKKILDAARALAPKLAEESVSAQSGALHNELKDRSGGGGSSSFESFECPK